MCLCCNSASTDRRKPARWHYELAKELSALRSKGVLIIGSGNIIHNLRLLNWQNPTQAFDWALELNGQVKEYIQQNDHQPLINYSSLGKAATLAIPTPEHYLPLLHTLELKEEQDTVQLLNDQVQLGSISMTSLKIA